MCRAALYRAAQAMMTRHRRIFLAMIISATVTNRTGRRDNQSAVEADNNPVVWQMNQKSCPIADGESQYSGARYNRGI